MKLRDFLEQASIEEGLGTTLKQIWRTKGFGNPGEEKYHRSMAKYFSNAHGASDPHSHWSALNDGEKKHNAVADAIAKGASPEEVAELVKNAEKLNKYLDYSF